MASKQAIKRHEHPKIGESNLRTTLFVCALLSAVSACLAQNMSGDILTGTAFTLFTRMDVPTGEVR
jgi:hypothetical protein